MCMFECIHVCMTMCACIHIYVCEDVCMHVMMKYPAVKKCKLYRSPHLNKKSNQRRNSYVFQ